MYAFLLCAKLLDKAQKVLQIGSEYSLHTEKVLDEYNFICTDKDDSVLYLEGLKRAIIKKEEALAQIRADIDKAIEELKQ